MADRWQAQYNFWASFGVPAYEEHSVPDADDVTFPYITYQAVTAHFNEDTVVSASVWTRSDSWGQADALADDIFEATDNGGAVVLYDGGMIWFTPETPFAQSMRDENDDAVKRKYINVAAHFC